MSKTIQANRYKPEPRKPKALKRWIITSTEGIDLCLKCIITIAFFSVLSLAAIFIYDFITQSKIFNIKNIEISGTQQVFKEDILKLSKLNLDTNIFKVNLYKIEKRISTHPWIASTIVKRNMACEIIISVIEEKALAIVKIKNQADIVINTNGKPFKEYNLLKDNNYNLPVIMGIDISLKIEHNLKLIHKNPKTQYLFRGSLFNSIVDFLKTDNSKNVTLITADQNRGISIETSDVYNKIPINHDNSIKIKLGFSKFKAKLNKAIKISEYIDKNFPERTICAMDLSNLEKVFIKTTSDRVLQNG